MLSNVPVVFSGPCGSGKTFLLRSFLYDLLEFKKMLLIERDVREFDLPFVDDRWSHFMHWISAHNFDVMTLLHYAQTLEPLPELICVSELTHNEIVEACNVVDQGVGFSATVHAVTAKDAYNRLGSLYVRAKRVVEQIPSTESLSEQHVGITGTGQLKFDFDESVEPDVGEVGVALIGDGESNIEGALDVAMLFCAERFPLVVQMDFETKCVSEIVECYVQDGRQVINTIYEKGQSDESSTIDMISRISQNLLHRLF